MVSTRRSASACNESSIDHDGLLRLAADADYCRRLPARETRYGDGRTRASDSEPLSIADWQLRRFTASRTIGQPGIPAPCTGAGGPR